MSPELRLSPLQPALPTSSQQKLRWTHLYGSARGLAIYEASNHQAATVVAIVPDTPSAMRLTEELRFYAGPGAAHRIHQFPDWETLPYDVFSPHHDIVSERLATLYHLPDLNGGVIVVPVTTIMAKLAPRSFLLGNTFMLTRGERLDLNATRLRLESAGYRFVGQVMEHGEFAVRGSLLDLFPMGSPAPYRVDLFDEEIDSIRSFDPETQRSLKTMEELRLIPAREYPTSESGIAQFRRGWRARFEGDATNCPIYRDVSQGLAPSGIEYYLPLFYEKTETFFDYLPKEVLFISFEEVHDAAESFWTEIGERYESHRYDKERPLVPPSELFLKTDEVFSALSKTRRITVGRFESEPGRGHCEYGTRVPTSLPIDGRATEPLAIVQKFVQEFRGRILFVAESSGRREVLLETFANRGLKPVSMSSWSEFVEHDTPVGIVVSPLEDGAVIHEPAIAVVTESQLFGARAMQQRRRKPSSRDAESLIRDLTELSMGTPVVHEHHGVGRYRGLTSLTLGGMTNEYLAIEYDGEDKLYVPVASLHLVTRYTGTDADNAPLHRLGSTQWQKAKKRAAEKAYDVAAELLEIHARRASRTGHKFDLSDFEYHTFAQAFPFEETPDQQAAIEAVIENMLSSQPMDRLVCGDVGFGKTEVAMRAAFVAVQDGWQVAILVPTTLLAQQHHQTLIDRFADWPVTIELLSRFRTKPQQDEVISKLGAGRVDIVVGTHKLLQSDVRFKRLGLLIIDEEHRFGVRQKERLKALRAEVDILTLTATPIPRTLNMALSGLRDLILIGTPPERRLSIKTFVQEWRDGLLREACIREIRRGGQVFFVHNRVETIKQIAEKVRKLVPEADVRIAHGQMREVELEQVMIDFYHRRFNLLICTTIIESGIDVPNANTIVINRADRFGLAQLHQLRGRVGRSHHRAYAYLVIPPRNLMTADAVKRLEAIESLEDLGIGFSLATHDFEIRGAGELLGEEQSGQIHEVGYSMYTDLLERAVQALRAGRSPELDRPLDHGTEIDLQTPALIPEDYLPDVHTRLIMYKRIASASSQPELRELQVEMIDRFGLLPQPTKTLFRITELKLEAAPLGIRKVDIGAGGGRVTFQANPDIDPGCVIRLIQEEPRIYRLDGPDKLRISTELPEVEDRIVILHELLQRLSIPQAA